MYPLKNLGTEKFSNKPIKGWQAWLKDKHHYRHIKPYLV